MSLPVYDFQYIKAGEGKTGTSGQLLEAMWKSNFDTIKSLFSTLDAEIVNKISSGDIKQLKVENGIVYYTLDGNSWISMQAEFSKISGDPMDNPALAAKFNEYTTIIEFEDLKDDVNSLSVTVSTMSNTVNTLNSDVATLKMQVQDSSSGILVRLAAVENSLNDKISSPTVITIREKQPGQLEYTTDGITWNPTAATLGVNWGEIFGDIENQADLINRFDIVHDRIDAIVTDITQIQSDLDSVEARTDSLETRMTTAETDISNLGTRVSTAETDIDSLEGRVGTLEADNTLNKQEIQNVKTDLASTQAEVDSLETRTDTLESSFSSLDSLVNSLDTSITSHLDNVNNPHQVTKAQVGLDQVDNTADLDKPMSAATKAYVDSQLIAASLFTLLTAAEYEQLRTDGQIDPNRLYFIKDKY